MIVDGTQTYSGRRKLNEGCLERHYNKGTEEESVNYHCDVLEANGIKKKQKNISSELLESFGQQITEQEDILQEDAHCASFG